MPGCGASRANPPALYSIHRTLERLQDEFDLPASVEASQSLDLEKVVEELLKMAD
jgi:hypothetical protein